MNEKVQLIDGGTFKVVQSDSMWKDFEFGVPTNVSTCFDDFYSYVAADWTVTETDAGATQALATSAPCKNGVLLVTNANADNNLVSMQKVGHSVTPTAGTNIYFETRFQVNTATQVDVLFGLIITDIDPITSITDGIVFRKDDGDTNIDFCTMASSVTSTETAIGTLTADTYVTLGFKVTGTSLVEYFVNGTKQGELTTCIPTTPLRVTMTFQDGDTGAIVGAQTMSIDYVFISQTRI